MFNVCLLSPRALVEEFSLAWVVSLVCYVNDYEETKLSFLIYEQQKHNSHKNEIEVINQCLSHMQSNICKSVSTDTDKTQSNDTVIY